MAENTTTAMFVGAVKTCFMKYVDFKGRAPRSEYWWFYLFNFIVQMVLLIISEPLSSAYTLAIFLPSLAVGVRRLHDTDRSGWWLLLVIIPLIGWILLLIWACQKGTSGNNRFGSDPLG